MSIKKSTISSEENKDGEEVPPPKEKLDQLRRDLLNNIKEAAQTAAMQHSISIIRSDSLGKSNEAPIDFKRMMSSISGR